jgi:hypothetical protein
MSKPILRFRERDALDQSAAKGQLSGGGARVAG